MEIKMCNNGKNKQSLINVYTLSGWKTRLRWLVGRTSCVGSGVLVAVARTKRVNDAWESGRGEVGGATSAADKRRSNNDNG